MEKINSISLFLLGILIFEIYSSLLKVVHLISEQFLNIESINSAIFIYGLLGVVVLLNVVYGSFYYLKKGSIKPLGIVILIVILGILLLTQYDLQKSEDLMINNFNLEKELRFKLLGVRSYVAVGLKIIFFLVLFLKILKKESPISPSS